MAINRFQVLGSAVLGFGFLVLGSGSGCLPSAAACVRSFADGVVRADGRPHARGSFSQSRARGRHTTADEGWIDRSPQKIRRPLSHRHVGRRLAELRRVGEGQPPYHPHADRQVERRPSGASMDLYHPDVAAPAGDAGGRRRHHVRHQRERVLRARCRQRPRDLALSTAAYAKVSSAMPPGASTEVSRLRASGYSW